MLQAQISDFDPLQGNHGGKILSAASDEDSTALEEILCVASTLPHEDKRHKWFTDYEEDNQLPCDELSYVIWTPLLEAIDHGRAKNVKLLLKAGADPQGIKVDDLRRRMAAFRIFNQLGRLPTFDAVHDACATEMQNARMEDLFGPDGSRGDRTRKMFITLFWDDEREEHWDLNRRDQTLHSLIRAAMMGNIEIFYLWLDEGADISYWLKPSIFQNVDSIPISMTALSTPLHAAARGDHIKMLEALLDLGFDPNCMPFASGPLAQTPIQACFSEPTPHLDAFGVLAAHPQIDFNILTSMHQVHLLHLVAAHLDTSILEESLSLGLAPTSVAPTALGHTLLHVVCLPQTWLDIQSFSRKVYASIHEVRFPGSGLMALSQLFSTTRLQTLDEPTSLDLPRVPNVDGPGFMETFDGGDPFLGVAVEERRFLPNDYLKLSAPPADYAEKQTETFQWLFSHGVTDIATQDVHGNTPMHCLASHRNINNDLVAFLRRNTEHGNRTWLQARNKSGLSEI